MKGPFFRFLILVLLLLLTGNAGVYAQILDDTTKSVYGPHTSRYRMEYDVFRNIDTLHSVDTLIDNIQYRDDFVFQNEEPYQDLGVLGSPSKPMFFKLPTQIGTRYGIETFDLLSYTPDKVRYFNTRSPYTYINYAFGGKKRSVLQGGLNRNINPHWNVGFDFKRVNAQKTMGVTSSDDPATSHLSIAGQVNHISQNGRYILFATYTYLNHDWFETGGAKPRSQDSISINDGTAKKLVQDSLFGYEEQGVRLSQYSRTKELRNNVHIYQQYAFDARKKNQVFLVIDRNRHINRYNDNTPGLSSLYNDTSIYRFGPIFRTDSVAQETKYKLLEEKAGIKGIYEHFAYAAWFRHRDFDYGGYQTAYSGIKSESFVGAMLNLAVNRDVFWANEAEIMPTRDYKLKSEINIEGFTGGLEIMRYSPSLFQQDYAGNYFIWHNQFKFTKAQRLFSCLDFKISGFKLKLGAEYINLNNYIFMNEFSVPQQLDNPVQVFMANVDFRFRLGNFHFDHHTRYAATGGPDVIRMPKIFAHARYFFQAPLFKNALRLQAGTDIRWKDAYFADNYNPVLQQFYIQKYLDPKLSVTNQNTFIISPYLLIEPFITFGIKRSTFFMKLTNANQGLGTKGYFTTPFYVAQKRIFQMGVYWHFFD